MAEKFTLTQQKFIDLLSDGLHHRREEFRKLLPDDLGADVNIQMHISNIRKILRPRGEDIICELRNRNSVCYRHVRLLASPNKS